MKADLGTQIIRKEVTRTMVLGGACLAALLVLSAVSLYPATLKSRSQQQRIGSLENKIAVQEKLQPLFIALENAEEKAQLPKNLKYVRLAPLSRARLLDFDDEIETLAECLRISVVSVAVQASAIDRNDQVLVDAVFLGNFEDFRLLLLGMGQLEWVHAITRLEVSGYTDKEQLSMQFELALD